jgi:hypothetical protein
LYRNELICFKEKCEELFEVTITEEQIKEAIFLRNRERVALKNFYGLMKIDPAPMKGSELYQVLYGSTFKFDKEQVIGELTALTEKVKKEYEAGNHLEKKPRIIITGSPVSGGALDEITRNKEMIPISSMCTVFAESEVISLLAQEKEPGSIALGIVHSICKRTANFAQNLNLNSSVFFTGGLARYSVFRETLEEYLALPIITNEMAQYAGAIGAAVIGYEQKGGTGS